jgi:hypothetical protein
VPAGLGYPGSTGGCATHVAELLSLLAHAASTACIHNNCCVVGRGHGTHKTSCVHVHARVHVHVWVSDVDKQAHLYVQRLQKDVLNLGLAHIWRQAAGPVALDYLVDQVI